MLSFKTTILFATAILAGGVSATGKCLNDAETHILLTDTAIWHDGHPGLLVTLYTTSLDIMKGS